MSIAEVERFAADVSSNAALRAEAEKAHAQASQATPVDNVIAFATAKGYSFTASELREHVRAKTQGGGRQVTDAELDGVSGGGDGFGWVMGGLMYVATMLGKPS
jgi:predicted ribosomally synthesized peptide with nif11-like leader